MKLVNLKNEADDSDYCCAMPVEQYGYGLRIYLNEDACEKLGIAKAAAGTQVTISAKAIVVSSTQSLESDGDDKGTDLSLSLQITDMGVQLNGVLRNAAEVLYGG
jgi:hypothetical protein